MKVALNFLLTIILFFSFNFSFSQLDKNIIVFEDIILKIDNNKIEINLKESSDEKIHRKIQIYQILYDVVLVDDNGSPNGVILEWDSTSYYGQWYQNNGEYELSLTYLDRNKNKINKKLKFNIK